MDNPSSIGPGYVGETCQIIPDDDADQLTWSGLRARLLFDVGRYLLERLGIRWAQRNAAEFRGVRQSRPTATGAQPAQQLTAQFGEREGIEAGPDVLPARLRPERSSQFGRRDAPLRFVQHPNPFGLHTNDFYFLGHGSTVMQADRSA